MTTFSGQTERTTVQVAPPPIDLNQRLDLPHAAMSIAGVIAGAILFAAGAGLFSFGTAIDIEMRGAGRWIAVVTGAGLAVAGVGIFVLAFWYLAGIVRYELQARWIWTDQTLKERDAQGGLIVEEERSTWSLHVDDARDMLLIVLYIYLQVRRGKRWPWSIDNLKGTLYLDNDTDRGRLIGMLSEHEARRVGEELVRLGLVRGRAEKSAGQWTAQTADDVLDAVITRMR